MEIVRNTKLETLRKKGNYKYFPKFQKFEAFQNKKHIMNLGDTKNVNVLQISNHFKQLQNVRFFLLIFILNSKLSILKKTKMFKFKNAKIYNSLD
jgi:hypothetical protein